jgi:UDP-N-acetylmuramate dehydrogenase
MEFVAGIPGTLGGALAMNAGTRIGEMKDVVRRVELATADGVGFVDAATLGFAYRTCRLPPGAVATRVEFALRPGDVAASEATMQEDRDRRRRTQPLDRPTFGSTFRNPPGDFAGRLIEAVGLKGHRVGGALWSDVHANFVVNAGGATARDVVTLLNLARSRVKERFGIALEAEVRLLGEFLAEDVEGLTG